MARYKWSFLGGAGFLTFFFFQATVIIHYAAKLEQAFESRVSDPVSASSLLSTANVSAQIRGYRKDIARLNIEHTIRNTDLFGNFSLDSTSPVFVIQVHDRLTYLEGLIGSLKKVRGIQDTLLIFSHDIYSKGINALIQSINFTRVMQIYYPYSSQLYPRGYPGPDPNGTVLPPGYGRTANLTQIKLHWIWKFTQVFRELRELKNHSGSKIFLEEDHYVSPDLLDVLSKTEAIRSKSCPTCLIILGGYPKEKLWPDMEWGLVKMTRFYASGNNMGMVLDRNFWNRFMECSRDFCAIDDYNWDWTLQHMHLQCFPEKIRILKVDAPRVWHAGDCGTHTKQKWKCKKARILETIRKFETLMETYKLNLFPQSLKMISTLKSPLPETPRPFGGWGDPRDHNLCLAILRGG